jgi:hypothetical protein
MNNFENAGGENQRPEIRSSLGKMEGHGSMREKRASVVEVYAKLKNIIGILPEESKKKLAREADMIRNDPEKAVEIIRNEIEAQQSIIDLLDNSISTEEALRQLDELLPKEKVQ